MCYHRGPQSSRTSGRSRWSPRWLTYDQKVGTALECATPNRLARVVIDYSTNSDFIFSRKYSNISSYFTIVMANKKYYQLIMVNIIGKSLGSSSFGQWSSFKGCRPARNMLKPSASRRHNKQAKHCLKTGGPLKPLVLNKVSVLKTASISVFLVSGMQKYRCAPKNMSNACQKVLKSKLPDPAWEASPFFPGTRPPKPPKIIACSRLTKLFQRAPPWMGRRICFQLKLEWFHHNWLIIHSNMIG